MMKVYTGDGGAAIFLHILQVWNHTLCAVTTKYF